MNSEEKMEDLVSKLFDQKLAELKRRLVPHHCFTCKHFKLRDKKPRNRVCKCPSELKVVKGQCFSWELEPDSSKWVTNKNMAT